MLAIKDDFVLIFALNMKKCIDYLFREEEKRGYYQKEIGKWTIDFFLFFSQIISCQKRPDFTFYEY